MPPHLPSSAIAAFIDTTRVDALLRPLIADEHDRAFIVRCLVGEGPAHHRGANYVLLALLERVLQRRGVSPAPLAGPTVSVPMRLPPHLADKQAPQTFALALPTAPLEALAEGDARTLSAMIDCLTDGPPQHALANVAMVTLLGRLLEQDGEQVG